MTRDAFRGWIIDAGVGALGGSMLGAIVAVNIVIYAGPDQGYESTISHVFKHNPVVGVATVATLVLGPIIGIAIARQVRRQRSQP